MGMQRAHLYKILESSEDPHSAWNHPKFKTVNHMVGFKRYVDHDDLGTAHADAASHKAETIHKDKDAVWDAHNEAHALHQSAASAHRDAGVKAHHWKQAEYHGDKASYHKAQLKNL
jgi:hypothetical protein